MLCTSQVDRNGLLLMLMLEIVDSLILSRPYKLERVSFSLIIRFPPNEDNFSSAVKSFKDGLSIISKSPTIDLKLSNPDKLCKLEFPDVHPPILKLELMESSPCRPDKLINESLSIIMISSTVERFSRPDKDCRLWLLLIFHLCLIFIILEVDF